MKILLTGGAGYIGSHTAVAMLEAGYDIAVVDNYANSSAEAIRRVEEITGREVSLYEGDVRDGALLDEIFAKENVAAVVHFAGLKAVGESVAKPLEYYSNNIDTTLELVKAMQRNGVNNIVFSSSATVYGEENEPPYFEEMPRGKCSNPYGWTKSMIEQILTDAAKANEEMKVVLLRYFNPVGAHPSGRIGEDPQGIPNNLMPYISQVAVGRRDHLTVFGDDYDTADGTCLRDYIHVMDLAEGHVKAVEYLLKAKACGGGGAAKDDERVSIFNLGTGNPYSVLDMVKAYGKACGTPIKYEIGPRRAGDLTSSFANADKAECMLGWKASRSLDDMCRDAWNWQSNNPEGYGK